MQYDFRLGSWVIEPSLNRATLDGQSVHLRPKVMDLLVLLSTHPQQVLSKDALLAGVWGTEFVSESALTTAIAELRQALGDDAEHPWLVETVPKRGYRSLVESIAVSPSPPSGEPARAAEDVPPPPPRAPRGPHLRLRTLTLVLVAFLIGTAGAVMALWLTTRTQEFQGWRTRQAIRHIAVLPFRYSSPADESLADALHAGVVAELRRLGRFERVIAHRSTLRYAEGPSASSDIGRDLLVQGVLAGTVRRSEGRLKIEVELIEVDSARQVWSEEFPQGPREVADLQRQTVLAIAREVDVTLSDAQPARLAGRSQQMAPGVSEPVARARDATRRIQYVEAGRYYEEALARDPELAEAWGELAMTLVYRAYGLGEAAVVPRARAAAEQALRLDPETAAARVALGRIRLNVDWDWDGAGRDLRQSVTHDPQSPDARLQYAYYLGVMGRFDESLEEAREAVRLDPLSPQAHFQLGFQSRTAGNYAPAIAHITEAMRLAPGRSFFVAQRAFTYALDGQCAQAFGDLATAGRSSFDGFVAAKCGKAEEARAIAAGLRKDGRCAADIYAALGDLDTAFSCLEEQFTARQFALAQIATSPLYVDLRPDPRFQALLRRMGYPR